ncbi:MAG TPA: hypothetical protein VGM98_09560 [Schlesneria sp.]
MRHYLWTWMLLGGALAFLPCSAEAQRFRRPFSGCCETCQHAHANCTCSQAVAPVQTQAVVQTHMQAQQVTTFQNVTETHVRNETIVQNVPVTTYKQVTVDEGGYQMVWVPKPVTKQVAQTVIQQQTATRAVPYQVTRQVPQISTQLVPVQTVQHVTAVAPMATFTPVRFQAAASSCNVCNHSQFGTTAFAAPVYVAPPQYNTALAPTIQYAAPQTATIQTLPAIPVPVPQTARGPLPAPANSTEQWQTIPSRPSPSTSQYEPPMSRTVPVPMDEARTMGPRMASRFTPAPSAATVWNSRQ